MVMYSDDAKLSMKDLYYFPNLYFRFQSEPKNKYNEYYIQARKKLSELSYDRMYAFPSSQV